MGLSQGMLQGLAEPTHRRTSRGSRGEHQKVRAAPPVNVSDTLAGPGLRTCAHNRVSDGLRVVEGISTVGRRVVDGGSSRTGVGTDLGGSRFVLVQLVAPAAKPRSPQVVKGGDELLERALLSGIPVCYGPMLRKTTGSTPVLYLRLT